MREESAAFKAQSPSPPVVSSSIPRGGLRSITEIIEDLRKPIAERHLKVRQQAGKQIHYIEWHTAVRYLDHYAPGWTFRIRVVTAIGDRCLVTASITIPSLNGDVTREVTGTEDEELKGYGDPSSMPRRWRSREQLQSLGWEYISTRSDL
jgi:hypothetical protein